MISGVCFFQGNHPHFIHLFGERNEKKQFDSDSINEKQTSKKQFILSIKKIYFQQKNIVKSG